MFRSIGYKLGIGIGAAMTHAQVVLLWLYAMIIAIWPIRLIVLEVVLRRIGRLSPESPRYEQPEPPLVSAILPARDEEQNLARLPRFAVGARLPEPRDYRGE